MTQTTNDRQSYNHHQSEFFTNHVGQELSINSPSSQTRTQSEQNSGLINVRYTANMTKGDFNRDVIVDVRSIAGESDQARNYEIPEAIAIHEDENHEHSNEQIIVDARPLPWYIRIKFWELCVTAILVVSAFAVAIVLLSINLSSSSTSGESLSIHQNDAPTSFPIYDITTLPTYEPSLKPSTQKYKEYIAMQRGVLEQIYIETDADSSWYTTAWIRM